MVKSLKEISWNVDEPTYRQDPALSYSTLSTYEREGKFDKLATLFDRKESPSLLWGSCLDTYLTDGEEAYENSFLVAEFPECSDTIITIVKALFDVYKDTYDTLASIPTSAIINVTEQVKYQLNWKPETRAKVVREKGEAYYNLLYLAGDRRIISEKTNSEVLAAVDALRTSPATANLFAKDNPLEPEIERLYQLKFKGVHNGVNYRIMMDEAYVDHEKKLIIPIDLKSSSKREYNFYKSFVEWRYDLQAKLYTDILKQNLEKDEYFKDFKVYPYIFVVVNNKGDNPTPLCWQFDLSTTTDGWKCGKDGKYEFRGPYEIGEELHKYLEFTPRVPEGIHLNKPNNLLEWLNK